MAILATSESINPDLLPARSHTSLTKSARMRRFLGQVRPRSGFRAWNVPLLLFLLAGTTAYLATAAPFLTLMVPYLVGAGWGAVLAVSWQISREQGASQRLFLRRYVYDGTETLVTALGELGHGYNERTKLAYYYGGHLTSAALRRQARDMLRHLQPTAALSASLRLAALLNCNSLPALVETLYIGTEETNSEHWEAWSRTTQQVSRVVNQLHHHLLQNPARTPAELAKVALLPETVAVTGRLNELAATVETMAREAVGRRRSHLEAHVKGPF